MQRRIDILKIALLLISVFSSCDSEDTLDQNFGTENQAGLKIMPLGASRVAGARPEFESYRYELWKLMVDAEWDFDYIGTVDDEASYPTYNNQTFDLDHEGRGGWTSGQLLSGIENWINSAGVPDIVLFSSPAGNDALQNLDYDQALVNVNSIIDVIQTVNPNVIVIIEQLAPGNSEIMTGDLKVYFDNIYSDVLSIAAAQTTEGTLPLWFLVFNDY